MQNECLYRETMPSSQLQLPEQGIKIIINLVKKLKSILSDKKLLAIGIAVSGIIIGDKWDFYDFTKFTGLEIY